MKSSIDNTKEDSKCIFNNDKVEKVNDGISKYKKLAQKEYRNK